MRDAVQLVAAAEGVCHHPHMPTHAPAIAASHCCDCQLPSRTFGSTPRGAHCKEVDQRRPANTNAQAVHLPLHGGRIQCGSTAASQRHAEHTSTSRKGKKSLPPALLRTHTQLHAIARAHKTSTGTALRSSSPPGLSTATAAAAAAAVAGPAPSPRGHPPPPHPSSTPHQGIAMAAAAAAAAGARRCTRMGMPPLAGMTMLSW